MNYKYKMKKLTHREAMRYAERELGGKEKFHKLMREEYGKWLAEGHHTTVKKRATLLLEKKKKVGK